MRFKEVDENKYINEANLNNYIDETTGLPLIYRN